MMLTYFLISILACTALAETGLDGWLRYAKLPSSKTKEHLQSFPRQVTAIDAENNGSINSAVSELKNGFSGMIDIKLSDGTKNHACHGSGTIVIATLHSYEAMCGDIHPAPELTSDGYWLSIDGSSTRILGQNERGALYGAFAYLSKIAQADFSDSSASMNPENPMRMVNQWDNMEWDEPADSIERGYGGVSIFFDGKAGVKDDLSRVTLYGRLLASVGINSIFINNVNADERLLTEDNLQGLKKIADLFRPWGVNVGISLNFASPQLLGNLSTFDPLDKGVIKWWTDKTDRIFQLVPDLFGYLVKANSEGQPGPLTYNRTLAQGANLFARAIKPHNGLVVFRGFVYDSELNEDDWYEDRANAAVDFFQGLDGKFLDNVIVQIKYGPIDFQVREPASPLFVHLPNTAMAIELEVTQEYLGQQCHLVYLPPLWQTVLGFDMRYGGKETYVRDIVSGRRFNKSIGGFAGVVNVGTDQTWIGSHLAMSNLYAFGRLAWNPTADSTEIIEEWTRLTFGLSSSVLDTVRDISMDSWPAYEDYSGNLGEQTLADILLTHFGPGPESMESHWGQWTRATFDSIGMDRTVWNGTGYSGQYPSEVAQKYEHPETTPDDLILWFHHVPYTYRLHSGKTVVQTFYDKHYDGAKKAQTFPARFETLQDQVDEERFDAIMYRLTYQAGHALVWRDAITEFYRNLSSIPDEHNRVRNHPWRVEAEHMELHGYNVVNVTPTEMASGYRAIVTNTTGTASTKLQFPSGKYDVAVNYYDVIGGRASYEMTLNNRTIGTWKGDSEDKLGHSFSTALDGHSAIRVTFKGINVKKGDRLAIKGTADGIEPAPIDYVSILPDGTID